MYCTHAQKCVERRPNNIDSQQNIPHKINVCLSDVPFSWLWGSGFPGSADKWWAEALPARVCPGPWACVSWVRVSVLDLPDFFSDLKIMELMLLCPWAECSVTFSRLKVPSKLSTEASTLPLSCTPKSSRTSGGHTVGKCSLPGRSSLQLTCNAALMALWIAIKVCPD